MSRKLDVLRANLLSSKEFYAFTATPKSSSSTGFFSRFFYALLLIHMKSSKAAILLKVHVVPLSHL